MVMFTCNVSRLGYAYLPKTYRGTPDTKALSEEVIEKLNRAEFRPAMRDGQPVAVMITGTVMFAIIDGKPRIRVFLNQDEKALLSGADFIAPQLILDYGTKLKRIEWPRQAGSRNGTASIAYTISATGENKGMRVAYEEPPKNGFASEVLRGTKEAPFIPGFRNGRPVSCTFEMPFFFRALRGPSWDT